MSGLCLIATDSAAMFAHPATVPDSNQRIFGLWIFTHVSCAAVSSNLHRAVAASNLCVCCTPQQVFQVIQFRFSVIDS